MRRLTPYLLLFLCLLARDAMAQGELFDVDLSRFPEITAALLRDLSGRGGDPAFTIRENGVERPSLGVTCPPPRPPLPISSVLAVDISGSMSGERLAFAQAATRLWVDSLPLGLSECAITAFNDRAYVVSDLTVDRDRLHASIGRLEAGGGTSYEEALLGRIGGAIDIAGRGRRRRIVVMLTDGTAAIDPARVIAAARAADVTLYCVSIELTMPLTLRAIAEATGGAWFERITSAEQARRIYATILRLAQGIEPCRITWPTEPDCAPLRHVEIVETWSGSRWSGAYRLDDSLMPRLDLFPRSFDFGELSVGSSRDTTVLLRAQRGEIVIEAPPPGASRLSISGVSFPFTLRDGESREVTLRFTPADSTVRIDQLSFPSSACTSDTLYATGGPRRSARRSLTVRHPNGGERFGVGEIVRIEWEGSLPDEPVRVEVSVDGGKNWEVIAAGAVGHALLWRAPATPSDSCLVRVTPAGSPVDTALRLHRHVSGLRAVAVDPLSRFVVTGGIDDTFHLWDPFTGTHLRQIASAGRGIYSLDVARNGGRVLAAISASTLFEFDPISGGALGAPTFMDIPAVAAYAPDDSFIAALSWTGGVSVLDLATGSRTTYARSHTEQGFAIAVHPRGDLLATGSNDGTAAIWRLEPPTRQALLAGHDGIVAGLSFDGGSRLVTASSDGGLRLWDVETGGLIERVAMPAPPTSVSFDHAGDRLAVGLEDGRILLLEAGTWRTTRTLRGHSASVTSLAWSADDAFIASASFDNDGRVWHLAPTAGDLSDAFWSIVPSRIKADAVDLGSVQVGRARDSVVTRLLCNEGERPLLLESVALQGGDAGDFAIVASPAQILVPAGGCVEVELRFAPTATGLRTTTIALLAGGDTLRVPLAGTGLAPTLLLEPEPVDFGPVLIGSMRDTVVAGMLRNVGSSPIAVESIGIAGPDRLQFELVGPSPGTIVPAGGALPVTLRFHPEQGGLSSTRLAVTGGGGSVDATLVGEGVCVAETGSVTLEAVGVSVRPGEPFELPLRVAGGAVAAGGTLRLQIRYPTRLLVPTDPAWQVWRDGDTSHALLTVKTLRRGDTVALLPMIAALADTAAAAVDIVAASIVDDCAPELAGGGSGVTMAICPIDGGRRIRLGEETALRLAPNPAVGVVAIDLRLLEEGSTRLFLVDARGVERLVIADGLLAAGPQRFVVDLRRLPAGFYRLVLTTPTERRDLPLIIRGR